MNYLFFNESNKLRSGWRIAIFLFVFFLVATFLTILQSDVLRRFAIDPIESKTIYFAVNGAGLLVLSLVLGGAAGRLFEDLPFRSIGASFANGWLGHLLLGLLIGAITLAIAVLIAFLCGGERFEFNASDTSSLTASLGISLVVIAINAAWEEAFFRGYIFQTLTRSDLAWLAVVLTSAFFGLVHLDNPNATAISTGNTILAGVWFGLAYLKTRNLWFVWGIHLMWNWVQGAVFGIEISGMTGLATTPLLREIDTGPTWLTGSTYGIEGGVACTFALIISMALIHFLPIKAEPPA